MNNHALLLLALGLVTRTVMFLVQPAFVVGAGTLELKQLSLSNPQYCEQAFYSRTVRLVWLGLCFFHYGVLSLQILRTVGLKIGI
jgi:hypothetical protein